MDARTCEGCEFYSNDPVTVNGQLRAVVRYCGKEDYDWFGHVPKDCARLGDYETLRELREL